MDTCGGIGINYWRSAGAGHCGNTIRKHSDSWLLDGQLNRPGKQRDITVEHTYHSLDSNEHLIKLSCESDHERVQRRR